MQNTDVKNWIIQWFNKKSDLNRKDIEMNSDTNYFLKGWIDSLKFILLITDIEDKFNIRFSNDEFQKREFATINGLSKIVKEKLHENI